MASNSQTEEEKSPFLPDFNSIDDDSQAEVLRHESRHHHHHEGRWQTITTSIFAGALLSSLLWLVAWTHHFNDNTKFAPSPTVSKTSCGWTYDMAVDRNCKFQLWSYSWVPQDCFDQKLNDDFLALRDKEDWKYYDSLEPLTEVPLESVLVGNRNDLYSTWGQHFWHCAFYQRKFFRVVEDNDGKRDSILKMTNRDLEEHHGLHCQEWLSDPKKFAWDEVNINLTVGYHFCS